MTEPKMKSVGLTTDADAGAKLSESHIDLLKTLIKAKLSNSEAANLGILFRRVIEGEISVSDIQDFLRHNDAPTREEAFAALAKHKLAN